MSSLDPFPLRTGDLPYPPLVPALTLRQLNRATLERQLLLDRREVLVTDALRRTVALQAQEPGAPYVALWSRIAGFDPADLDAAFRDGSVVKATLMRITLHAVLRDDYTRFHAAMVPNLRASRLNDRRYRDTDLTIADADELLPHLLEFVQEPRTKDEIQEMLIGHLGDRFDDRLWWAYRTFAPVVHVPADSHDWSFSLPQRFGTAPDHPPRPGTEEALQHLVLRYLEGFGPASPEDFAQFALQHRAVARSAFEALGDRLVALEGPNGATLFDLPDRTVPDGDSPAPPRLLGMWDSTLLAYSDRSRVISDEVRSEVIRRNGDVLPTVWVDGFAVGTWRATEGGIEVLPLAPIPDGAWVHLHEEAASLADAILARDGRIFSRYDHWWEKLPKQGRRVL